MQNDSFFEDWVNDKWVLSVQATDGLENLSNYAYVDEFQFPYTGKATLRETIRRALEKTGLKIPSRYVTTSDTNDNYPVEVFIDTTGTQADYFDQLIGQNNFNESDDVNQKKCLTVLEWILTGANAFLCQYNGFWHIMWTLQIPNELVNGNFKFKLYDEDGNFIGTQSEGPKVTIGSQINAFYPHHVKENQRIERRASLGAAKIAYVYGTPEDILRNVNFENTGSPPLTGWTINPANAGSITLNAGPSNTLNLGIASGGGETGALITSDPSFVPVQAGQVLSGNYIFTPKIRTDIPTFPGQIYRQRIMVTLSDGSTTYWLDQKGSWETSSRRIEYNVIYKGGQAVITTAPIGSEPAPITGDIVFVFYPVDDNSGSGFFIKEIVLQSMRFTALFPETAGFTQQETTVQTLNNASPVTYEPSDVQLGDATGVLRRSTLFIPDGSEPSEFGYSSPTIALALPQNQRLYTIAMVDVLILQSKIAKIFSGSVYGFVPYLKRIEIDGIQGTFMVLGWDWNAGENLIELKLYQVFWERAAAPPLPPFFQNLETPLIIETNGETVSPPIKWS